MLMNIALLSKQHSNIRLAINELCELVDGPLEKGLPIVAGARLKLAKAVAVNTSTEADYIHGPLKNLDLTRQVSEYTVLEANTHHLRLMFSRHITMWTTAAIEKDWTGYGRSLKGITAQLLAILDLEERTLFPAAQTLLAGRQSPH